VWRAGAEDKSKGAARDIAANQQDRRTDLDVCKAWLSVVFVFLRWAIIPGREPRINNNKSHRTGFSFGVFPWVIYPKNCLQCVLVFIFMLLLIYLVK
jgi:hypothetical protein